jgi:flavin-dependent dehydrogenase
MPELVTGSNIKTDVCVIGGGPAGSTLARRLRQLGHSVVLIEKRTFPRSHIGESLISGVLPLFDVLGLREEIENAGFLRPRGAIVRWSAALEQREIAGEPGFQVDRGRFDNILLQAAAALGTHILQPARAITIKRLHTGNWYSTVHCKTGNVTVESRFVADATGRDGFLAGVKKRSLARTLALYAYWTDVHFDGPETRIDRSEEGWFWGAPLPDGKLNATVFIDTSQYQTGIARAGNLESFYKELLARSELLADCLKGSLIGRVRGCDATQVYDDEPATPDTIKLGEAAFSIDPLSSQGVQTAIGSALHAAVVIHTILLRPDDTELALEFYKMRQRQSVNLHAKAAEQFYGEIASEMSGEFWRRRLTNLKNTAPETAWPEPPQLTPLTYIHLSPDIRFGELPVIQGDFIAPIQAIFSPRLHQPVAFFAGMAIAPLVAGIQHPVTAQQLLQAWAEKMPFDQAKTILQWLWGAGILSS